MFESVVCRSFARLIPANAIISFNFKSFVVCDFDFFAAGSLQGASCFVFLLVFLSPTDDVVTVSLLDFCFFPPLAAISRVSSSNAFFSFMLSPLFPQILISFAKFCKLVKKSVSLPWPSPSLIFVFIPLHFEAPEIFVEETNNKTCQ